MRWTYLRHSTKVAVRRGVQNSLGTWQHAVLSNSLSPDLQLVVFFSHTDRHMCVIDNNLGTLVSMVWILLFGAGYLLYKYYVNTPGEATDEARKAQAALTVSFWHLLTLVASFFWIIPLESVIGTFCYD